MDGHPALWEQQGYGEFCEDYIKNPERLYGTRVKCVSCALEVQDWTAAAYFLRLFPWETEDILRQYYPVLEKWKETYSARYADMLLEILDEIAGSCGIPDVSTISGIGGDCEAPIPSYLLLQKALDDFKNGKQDQGLELLVYCMFHGEAPYIRQL